MSISELEQMTMTRIDSSYSVSSFAEVINKNGGIWNTNIITPNKTDYRSQVDPNFRVIFSWMAADDHSWDIEYTVDYGSPVLCVGFYNLMLYVESWAPKLEYAVYSVRSPQYDIIATVNGEEVEMKSYYADGMLLENSPMTPAIVKVNPAAPIGRIGNGVTKIVGKLYLPVLRRVRL